MMVKPVCKVLIPETLERAFLFVADFLAALGLSIENPESAKITTWTNEGDQKEILVERVIGEVASGAVNNVQFWKNSSEDVFVAWREGADGCSFSIYLDGMDSALSVMLTSKLVESVLVGFRNRYGEGVALTVEFE
ncbi:hypothetical protein [Ralstonia pseudosolanacearum]|uniref:hypothetical protein n=1 Tax=Ralstonia pseudosolanacearum TaxID=1310165 RepID=UPI001C8C82B3|nr:hypothetical protein [Ralstonia pseudosolanacearum]MBX9432194.1 hypothetical protein [Ralstonia pseudosolanacearum]